MARAKPTHRLLERQLRKARTADGGLDIDALLALVDRAYCDQDRDRDIGKRAIDLMSAELIEINEKIELRAAAELIELNEKIELRAAAEAQQFRGELERTQAEGQRLAAALDGISDGVALFDRDDRLITCNPAYKQRHATLAHHLVSGCPFETVVREIVATGRVKLDGLSPEDYMKRRLTQHSEHSSLERQLANGDWEQVREHPLPDGSWLVILTDITTHKLAEEREVAARRAAEAANVAKSHFLANMSHELRTPLNAIIGFSEIMVRQMLGPLGNARYAEYAQDVLNSGRHLLNLINEILDLAKIESGRAELEESEHELHAIAQDATTMVQQAAVRGKVALDVSLAPRLPKLRIDGRKLTQVLVNLLSNAVKFTRPGGRVTVTAWAGEGGVVVQVTDTGIGMKSEDIPLAFTAFTQLDSGLSRKHEGTGLGLPLAKSLVELHGGSLDLQSRPGKGTIATVRLPASRIVGRRKSPLSAAS